MDGRSQKFNSRRNRNSILQSAGDALGLRTNKRKRMSRQQLEDDVVLEISAATKTEGYEFAPIREFEDESTERERLLRDAAEAVGLPHLGQQQTSEDSGAFNSGPRKIKGIQKKITLPPYPALLLDMQPLVQVSSSLLKFYPAASPFSILSRSRQWKARYLILTTLKSQREHGFTESQLHLFKTDASDERELERLTINQESFVHIADEEVGGNRKFVIKVKGRAVDSTKREGISTTWLLQLSDANQMQRWIKFIKGTVLTQIAERNGVDLTLQRDAHNGGIFEFNGDMDVMLSMGKQGLLTSPLSFPTPLPSDTGSKKPPPGPDDTLVGNHKQGNPPSSITTSPVSAIKGLWNGRPSSRQLSISGSSVATALASPTQNSVSAQTTIPETDDTVQEEHSVKTPREAITHILRPTSPSQAQAAMTTLSPPMSPISTLPYPDEPTISSTSTLGARFSQPTGPRHIHHSSAFSVEWDGYEGGSVTAKRIAQSTALAPPPRRRPLTGSGLPGRQGSPPKEMTDERLYTPPPPRSEEPAPSVNDDEESRLDTSAEPVSYFSMDDGDIVQDIIIPGDVSIDDSPEDELPPPQRVRLLPQLPSPILPTMQQSSTSSLGARTSSKTPTHEHAGDSRASTPSFQSELRETPIEDEMKGNDEEFEQVNHFHLPTGSRRRSRLGSFPRQLSSPASQPHSFHSPPFPAHSPLQDYTSSERPGSSSSIPSTVPSMNAGLSPLMSKRISTITTSDAPSFQSTESSNSLSNSRHTGGSSLGSGRHSSVPGPAGPRPQPYPPQRPAPSQAPPLPPAPLDDMTSVGGRYRHSLSGRFHSTNSSHNTVPSSRQDGIVRFTRHSLGPAGPPPTMALPPRPDNIQSSPRNSGSSTGHPHLQSLFPNLISTSRSRKEPTLSAMAPPPMAPPPMGPLPPTPLLNDGDRSVSPSMSVTSISSTRSTPAVNISRMTSLKQRFRIMSNPTPMTLHERQPIPPAQPPPTFPPPAIPESLGSFDDPRLIVSRHEYMSTDSQNNEWSQSGGGSSSGPLMGETNPSRRDSAFASVYANGTHSPTNPMMPSITAFASMAMRSQPTTSSDLTPLSPPPPRRNSRTSREMTPEEKERWISVMQSLEENEAASAPYYSNPPALHSGIDLSRPVAVRAGATPPMPV